jgi:hypothetical protein
VSETGDGSGRIRSRVTITPASDTGFHFVVERAQGDGPWVVEARQRYRRLPR